MLFKEVIDQEQVKKRLIKTVRQNRVGHAQLFLGHSGAGSLALATAYAQYVLCENRSTEDSCGTCPSCTKVARFVHPDLHFSYPVIKKEGKTAPPISTDYIKEWRSAFLHNPYLDINEWLDFLKAENKQGNITKDECRDILWKLSLKTFESEYKILILWMAEYLKDSGNVLLKIIEEPPPKTLIILVAEQEEFILNTILSRTQLVKINKLTDDGIVGRLLQQTDLDESSARQVAFLAEGNFCEALKIYQEQSGNQYQFLRKWLKLWFDPNAATMIAWVDEIAGLGREKQKNLLRYSLHFIRESMALGMLTSYQPRLRNEEIEGARFFANKIDEEQLEMLNIILNDLHYYIERNANPKIQFLNTTIRCSKIIKKNDVLTSAML